MLVSLCKGQDLIPHSSGGGGELNGTIRLSAPAIGSQPAGATLTISNDQLLAQTATLTSSGTPPSLPPGKLSFRPRQPCH